MSGPRGPYKKQRTLMQRCMDKVVIGPASGCWLWQGANTGNGYGQVRLNRKTELAHRIVYQIHKGEIPEGLDLDHLCRTRRCVNPDHLEPVSRRENLVRGAGPQMQSKRLRSQTHCKRGHPFSGNNLHVGSDGRRSCKRCHNDSQKRRYDQASPNTQETINVR